MIKQLSASLAAVIASASAAAAVTIQLSVGGSNFNFPDPVQSTFSESNASGSASFDLASGEFRVYSSSLNTGNENYASLSSQGDIPLFRNVSAVSKPIRIEMDYDGFYYVPPTKDSSASSRGLVDVVTGSKSAFASIEHIVDHDGEERRELLIDKEGGSETLLFGTEGSASVISASTTGISARVTAGSIISGLILEPGASPDHFNIFLGAGSGLGGVADFRSTGQISIFVDDLDDFEFDPRISAWVHEAGSSDGGDDGDDMPPAIPLPGGLPLLLTASALGLALRRSRPAARRP